MMPIDDIQALSTLSVKHTALYKKGIHIYTLSRKLNEPNIPNITRQEKALYLLNNKELIESAALVTIRLPFTIAIAQTTPNYKLKLLSIRRVLMSILSLEMYCKKLKEERQSGCEHISALQKELKIFAKLYHSWSLVLTQQN